MKEKRDIISSYNQLLLNGKKCALATVVHVEGSSYRRPGARMLISEDGNLTGAISGGCLEGDAMRKALHVINQQIPCLVTYDTMDDDDAVIGIGLGCNGIIKILIEPVDMNGKFNPLKILNAIHDQRQKLVIATFFHSNKQNRFTQVPDCIWISMVKCMEICFFWPITLL
ncbi:MAG: XdhC family protein [Saprospiraceae bacterium]|nr:XdhC family protein [Saprospiraceae bacterium]